MHYFRYYDRILEVFSVLKGSKCHKFNVEIWKYNTAEQINSPLKSYQKISCFKVNFTLYISLARDYRLQKLLVILNTILSV